MKPVVLSKRLKAVADMVTIGNRVCDVGCDHGFVPIYLVEQGISPTVLAMDVKSGPLSAAKSHIAEYGMDNVIETRLSDGLHNYNIDESDTLICAGMGGRLMMRILSDNKRKTESFQELILQPQSEIEQFRAWLRGQGYCITAENMIEEDGKFYPMMRVEPDALVKTAMTYEDAGIYQELKRRKADSHTGTMPLWNSTCDCIDDTELCKLADRYGPFLLLNRDKTLSSFLKREMRIYGEILTELTTQGLAEEKHKKRYEEVHNLLEDCRKALDMITLTE